MEFKYIMVGVITGGVIRNIPLIFPKSITHVAFWESVKHLDQLLGGRIVAAGLVNLHVLAGVQPHQACFDKSSTLGVSSRPEDGGIIRHFNYYHGIMP